MLVIHAKPKNSRVIFGRKVNIKIVTDENFDAVLRTGNILLKEVIANNVVVCNPGLFVTMLWRQYIWR